jgi:hypothetical protein
MKRMWLIRGGMSLNASLAFVHVEADFAEQALRPLAP